MNIPIEELINKQGTKKGGIAAIGIGAVWAVPLSPEEMWIKAVVIGAITVFAIAAQLTLDIQAGRAKNGGTPNGD